MHADLAGLPIKRDLGDLSAMGAKGIGIGDAQRPPVALAVPFRHLGDGLDDFARPRLVLQQLQSKRHRIDSLGGGDFVDDTFDAEPGVANPDREPEAYVQAVILADILDLMRRDGIVEMRTLSHDTVVAAFALEQLRHRIVADSIFARTMPPA
ncbi:MAG: hypothetical protein E5Y60_04310, partial [Mesorhizobium sp.]